MNRILIWFKTSHRWQHLAGGFVIGLIAGSNRSAIIAGVGIASALEFKDKEWGGRWDWIDWGLTVAGTAIGRFLGAIIGV